MNWFEDDERLPISMIKQYTYCKRRFSLMFIDSQWSSNYKIAEGDITHRMVDDPFFNEKRPGIQKSRSVPVYSGKVGIYGIADMVEFIADSEGIPVIGKSGKWIINPVEYKNGKPEKSKADEFQLITQALCLEEMFKCSINTGDIYYRKLRRRRKVIITSELKIKVESIWDDIRISFQKATIFKKEDNQNCSLCSLIDICLPEALEEKRSVRRRLSL